MRKLRLREVKPFASTFLSPGKSSAPWRENVLRRGPHLFALSLSPESPPQCPRSPVRCFERFPCDTLEAPSAVGDMAVRNTGSTGVSLRHTGLSLHTWKMGLIGISASKEKQVACTASARHEPLLLCLSVFMSLAVLEASQEGGLFLDPCLSAPRSVPGTQEMLNRYLRALWKLPETKAEHSLA